MDVYNQNTEECEPVTISEEDEITILQYHSSFIYEIDFKFYIIIGMGKYVENKDPGMFEFFKIEKCLAELRYNPDLSLCDIEFYIRELNKNKT